MTLSTTASRVSYPGAGSVGPFAFPFRVQAAADLLVTRRNSAGSETPLNYITQYSVAGVGSATGSVTLVDALLAGETLVVRRAPALKQSVSIRNQGPYHAAVHEDEFDRLVMYDQKQQDEIDRSIKFSETTAPGSISAILPAPIANQVLAWNSTGTAIDSRIVDGTVVTLPGGARTVANLTNYLANNAVFNVMDYGTTGSGADESSKVLATIAAAQVAGGIVFTPFITVRVDSQILMANDGTSPPKQQSVRFTGMGAGHSGQGSAAKTGSIWDLRYNGGGVAMIDTRGLGMLEIDHMTMACNDAAVTKPFIQTTNTTLHIHDTEFQGSLTKSLTGCDQDAIILGGTSLVIDGNSNAPFQGYGTVIRDCFFSHIRRAVYGRTFCNGVQILDNTIWSTCGSNLGGGAAIEFLGLAGNTCTGNVVAHNLIEIQGYPYGIKAEQTVNSTFAFNNCFDASGTTVASVRFEANALYNLVIDGYRNDTKPGISDASTGGPHNTFITSHANQNSIITEPQVWTNLNTFLNAAAQGPNVQDPSGNIWGNKIVTAGTGEKWQLNYTPSGGGAELQMYWWRIDANTRHLRLSGSGTHKIIAEGTGSLQFDTITAGNTVQVGGTGAGILGGGGKAGFYGAGGVVKQTVAGAKGGNAALGSLIAALVAMNMVIDTTTA